MAPSAVSTTETEHAVTLKPTKANGHRIEKKEKTPLEMISQGVCLPGIPRHPSFAEHRQWMLEKMALAFRVFARKGYTEGMSGHISVRDPENPHTFVGQLDMSKAAKLQLIFHTVDKPTWSPLWSP